MLSWSFNVFSHLGVFLISVKPLTTENKTTPKICKITVFGDKLHFVRFSGSRLGNYRKRGSASYIVREWLLWVVVVVVVVVVERERERETPVTSLISRWNREWSCIWLPRRRVDPTRRRVLTLWASRVLELRSACKDKELGAWALDWAAGPSDWWMTMGEVEALRSLVRLPWITQQHFVGMLQARRIDQVDVYFLFQWQWFCLWEQLGYSGYPFASVPARCKKTTLLETW